MPSLAATAACLATWAGGLLFGADGIAGLRFRYARGCLPRPRDRLGRRDRSGFDQGLLLSRRAPRVSEGLAKLPHCRALRFAPVAPRGARGESVPDAGASPRRLQNALASRKRHLGVGSHHPWLPANAGFPPAVWSPSLSELPPTTPPYSGNEAPSVYRWHQSGTSAACLAAH